MVGCSVIFFKMYSVADNLTTSSLLSSRETKVLAAFVRFFLNISSDFSSGVFDFVLLISLIND